MAEEVKNTEVNAEQIDYKAEIERLTAEVTKLKQATTNASADASKYKKEAAEVREKLSARMSEQERADQERAERDAERERRIAELEHKEMISTYTAKLLEAGYDPTTATEMAQMLPPGITDDYFARQKSFRENEITRIKAEALNSQPKLTSGTTPTSEDADTTRYANLRKYAGLKN